jgi:hypothetical protein
MNKIIIPFLMLMTLSLSGCIFDPFYGDHGGGHYGGGWGYHDRGDYRGR